MRGLCQSVESSDPHKGDPVSPGALFVPSSRAQLPMPTTLGMVIFLAQFFIFWKIRMDQSPIVRWGLAPTAGITENLSR